jgi:hypothetical protein
VRVIVNGEVVPEALGGKSSATATGVQPGRREGVGGEVGVFAPVALRVEWRF